jgi:hypothetical protein
MTTRSKHLEPRWPAMLALLAVGGLRLALPEPLSVGPGWLLILVVGTLIIPTVLARRHGNDRLNQILGYLLASIVTLDMVWSLGLLLRALPSHKETPKDLLISAAALWITNILVFASWYWRLDAGGPSGISYRCSWWEIPMNRTTAGRVYVAVSLVRSFSIPDIPRKARKQHSEHAPRYTNLIAMDAA